MIFFDVLTFLRFPECCLGFPRFVPEISRGKNAALLKIVWFSLNYRMFLLKKYETKCVLIGKYSMEYEFEVKDVQIQRTEANRREKQP